jgi:hypothetical protein
MSTLTEKIAIYAPYAFAILIFIVIVLLAIPGLYNMYLGLSTLWGAKVKYAFDDLKYDTSGNADIISMICVVVVCLIIANGVDSYMWMLEHRSYN